MAGNSTELLAGRILVILAGWLVFIAATALVLWVISDPLIFLIACLVCYDIGCGLLGYTLASTILRKGATPFLWAYGGFVVGFVSEIAIPLVITRF